MVHCRFTSAKGSCFSIRRMLTALSLILLTLPAFAQNVKTPAELLEAEEEKRNKIIFYVASGLGIAVMVAGAWILGNGKTKDNSTSNPAHTTPGMRISAGRTNDPYMRRKVVKKSS